MTGEAKNFGDHDTSQNPDETLISGQRLEPIDEARMKLQGLNFFKLPDVERHFNEVVTEGPPVTEEWRLIFRHAIGRTVGSDNTARNITQSVSEETKPEHVVFRSDNLEGVIAVPELGSGGMGIVMIVIQLPTRKNLVVKIPKMDQNPETKSLFEKEGLAVETMAGDVFPKFECKGSVNIHGQLVPFYAMEYLDNFSSLAKIIESGKKLPLQACIDATLLMLLNREKIAAKEIVHRDLKPENMLLLPNGTIKWIDPGLAKQKKQKKTDASTSHTNVSVSRGKGFFGTPMHGPPERWGIFPSTEVKEAYEAEIDTYRTAEDMFSIGTTAYMLATHESPYIVGDVMEIPVEFQKDTPHHQYFDQSALHKKFYALIKRLMDKNPIVRWQDQQEIFKAMLQISSYAGKCRGNPNTFKARKEFHRLRITEDLFPKESAVDRAFAQPDPILYVNSIERGYESYTPEDSNFENTVIGLSDDEEGATSDPSRTTIALPEKSISRRKALIGAGATVLTAGLGTAGYIFHQSGRQPSHEGDGSLDEKIRLGKLSREELIQEIQKTHHVLQTLPTVDQEGKEAFQLNKVTPVGWELVPYTYHTRLELLNDSIKPAGSILVLVPANIGDQRHIASRVIVESQGKIITDNRIGVSLIYSKEIKANQHEQNAAYNVTFRDLKGDVLVRVETWMLQPVFGEWSDEEIETYMRSLPEYATVEAALLNAQSVRYNSAIRGSNYEALLRQKKEKGFIEGDCGPQAIIFSTENGLPNVYVEGHLTDNASISNNGGMHARVHLFTPQGVLQVEPQQKTSNIFLPQIGLIVNKMSPRNRFPGWAIPDGDELNGGRWVANGTNEDYRYTPTRLSSPQAGEFAELTRNLVPLESIVVLFEQQRDQLEKAYRTMRR